jgi:hypothetical protein
MQGNDDSMKRAMLSDVIKDYLDREDVFVFDSSSNGPSSVTTEVCGHFLASPHSSLIGIH